MGVEYEVKTVKEVEVRNKIQAQREVECKKGENINIQIC